MYRILIAILFILEYNMSIMGNVKSILNKNFGKLFR